MHPATTCHARGCMLPVTPPQLFCSQHWRRISRPTQLALATAVRRAASDERLYSDEVAGLVALANGELLPIARVVHSCTSEETFA